MAGSKSTLPAARTRSTNSPVIFAADRASATSVTWKNRRRKSRVMEHSKSASRWTIPVLLFVTIAAFYWKLTLTRQFTWTSGPDLAEQVLPWFDLQARELHAGRIPLWDPYVWVGQPMIGQAQPGTAYPLNWLLFAMPLVDGHISPVVLNWYYVVIHFMAAVFAYLFCRDLGRSQATSFA